MKTNTTVSQLYPRDNTPDRLILHEAHHPMDPLILERLRPCAVPAYPRTPHRRTNPIESEVVQEPLRRVLTSPVRETPRTPNGFADPLPSELRQAKLNRGACDVAIIAVLA